MFYVKFCAKFKRAWFYDFCLSQKASAINLKIKAKLNLAREGFKIRFAKARQKRGKCLNLAEKY